MICLECQVLDRLQLAAVGACRECGAGVCLEHGWLRYLAGRHAGMAGPAHGRSRTLLCRFCATACTDTLPAGQPGAATQRP